MSYEVEKGIEVGKNQKYPFDTMEVGDSFFVPEADLHGLKRPISAVRAAATQHGKKAGHKFTVKTVEGGYRCWRIG